MFFRSRSNKLDCAVICLVAVALCSMQLPAAESDLPEPSVYSTCPVHDSDGIGKCYLGREIAQVMGHLGAEWLERPEREAEEHTDKLVELLALKPGQAVADIGAGTGYFTRRITPCLLPGGRVFAVDIQPEMLVLLTNQLTRVGITNVVAVLGSESSPQLPEAAVDVALMVDVYHEFSFPREMMLGICRAMKPGGRVVFVEYRAEDPVVPIKPVHKMSEAQVRREMAGLPLDWVSTATNLPRQYVITFRKREPSAPASGREKR